MQIHFERTSFHTVRNRQRIFWRCVCVRFIFSYELFYGGSAGRYLIRTQIKAIWKNARKSCFALSLLEHWNKLLREVIKSPFLEIFKTHLDTVLSILLRVTVCEQEAELEGLQRSLLTSAIPWWESLWGVLWSLLTAPNDKWFGRGWE